MSKRRRHSDEHDTLDEPLEPQWDDEDALDDDSLDADWADDEQVKSRSQIKREMDALQDLGRDLVELPDKALTKIPLSDTLIDAIKLARKIQNTRGGYRRQLQYIGKLMRGEDAAPIQAALDAIRQTGQQSAAKFHALERWRDRILNEGQDAVDQFVDEHPGADRQQLRQLMLNAQREHKQNKPPKSARALFKYLRELCEQGEA